MDLFSDISCSIKTNASDNTARSDCWEQNKFSELAAYYSQIIRNSKATKTRLPNKYQVRLNRNCNRTYPPTSSPSTSNTSRNIVTNDTHERNHPSNAVRKLPKKISQKSTHIIHHQTADSQVSCSKNLSRVNVESKMTFSNPINARQMNNNKHESYQTTDSIVGPSFADKTTYCRPAVDNREFVYKTMERNVRLRGLVRRLVIAREKEKQKVAWNNYINELKNKHRYESESHNPEIIDEYYNTRFTWNHSNPCQDLLQDFYGAASQIQVSDHQVPLVNRPIYHRPYIYENTKYCLPTASQGHLKTLHRERPKYFYTNLPHMRPTGRFQEIPSKYQDTPNRYLGTPSKYKETPIIIEKETNSLSSHKNVSKRILSNKGLNFKKHNILKNTPVQTDLGVIFTDSPERESEPLKTEETFKEKYIKVTNNVEKLKQKIMSTQSEVNYCSLFTIENKLDSLINSVNTFLTEMKSQNNSNFSKCASVTCQLSNRSNLLNSTKSDTFGSIRREKHIYGTVQERTQSTLTLNEGKRRGLFLDKLVDDDIYNSNKVKIDIEEMLNQPFRERPSVHITFGLPTKERETQFAGSSTKQHSNIEVYRDSHDKRMTIAVNTDPLGLLALFRVSAETVKQILSYMPNINYYSYLSRLPLPQSKNEMSTHYVCNICGAAFDRPSQLSDHIQRHNFGNVRACNVCRHALDMNRDNRSLFSCRHCGQRFTRAYCRELHQQACAKILGRCSNDTSSFIQLS